MLVSSRKYWSGLFLYALALWFLAQQRPFWVDELLQLFGTRDLAGSNLLRYVGTFPGAAPIGYFAQHWAIATLGFSPFSSARLFSIIPCILGCFGLTILLRYLGIRDRYGITILCWMLLPLQLRYGVEARPYALALFFSIVATGLFFRLLENPSRSNGSSYCFAVILALYTAPYTIFLQAGFVLCAICSRRNRSAGTISSAALAVAALSFAPWYWASANYWKHYLAVTADVGFKVTPKFFLLPIQEISGGGIYAPSPSFSWQLSAIALRDYWGFKKTAYCSESYRASPARSRPT